MTLKYNDNLTCSPCQKYPRNKVKRPEDFMYSLSTV